MKSNCSSLLYEHSSSIYESYYIHAKHLNHVLLHLKLSYNRAQLKKKKKAIMFHHHPISVS